MRHAPLAPSFFESNRRRLTVLLPQKSVALLHAADLLPTSGDGTLRLHPAPDLFYLSGIEQEESVLVLAPDAHEPLQREMLFVRQPNEHLRQWEGEKLTKEKAQELSGIASIRWLSDLPAVLHSLLCESDTLFLNSNEHERAVIDVEPRDTRMARQLINRYPLHRFQRLAPLMRSLRAVKSQVEVDLTRTAIDITDSGLRRAIAAIRPGVMEYELEAELIYEFTRKKATMAYEPIIGSGKNACVLHYLTNDKPCLDGELVLMDVGASYANYSADITRTYPVSGTFTPRQRAVYEAVLRVMKSSIARTTVGTLPRDWKRAAQEEMKNELVTLNLITPEQASKDTPEEPACKKYFMHGLGHSLGLGVHDVAPLNGPFEAGWILTVEPGIYIPEEGIGIRLENNILVTAQGPEDLSAHIPVLPDDIESLMKQR